MSPVDGDISDQLAKEMGFGIPIAGNPLKPNDVIYSRALGSLPPTCPICEQIGVMVLLYPTNVNPKGDLLFECLNAAGAIGAGHYEAVWRRGTNTWEPRPGSTVKHWRAPTLIQVSEQGKHRKKGKGAKKPKAIVVTGKQAAKVSPIRPAHTGDAPVTYKKGQIITLPDGTKVKVLADSRGPRPASKKKARASTTPVTIRQRPGVRPETVIPGSAKQKIRIGIDPTSFEQLPPSSPIQDESRGRQPKRRVK